MSEQITPITEQTPVAVAKPVKYALCFNAAKVDAALAASRYPIIPIADLMHMEPNLRDRAECETNTEWLQPILYVMITDPTQSVAFSYQRPSKGDESRLHGRRSIGLGGHVDIMPEDGDLVSLFTSECLRELSEEVGLVYSDELRDHIHHSLSKGFYSFIRNTDNEVDSVHLGIVLEIIVPSPDFLTKLGVNEIASPKWISTEKYSETRSEYEGWSQIIVDRIIRNGSTRFSSLIAHMRTA